MIPPFRLYLTTELKNAFILLYLLGSDVTVGREIISLSHPQLLLVKTQNFEHISLKMVFMSENRKTDELNISAGNLLLENIRKQEKKSYFSPLMHFLKSCWCSANFGAPVYTIKPAGLCLIQILKEFEPTWGQLVGQSEDPRCYQMRHTLHPADGQLHLFSNVYVCFSQWS